MLLLAFLLLLGSASVNIPFALGVTTVVGVSDVAGVPFVTGILSVFSIHVSFCCCWGPAVAGALLLLTYFLSTFHPVMWRPCCLAGVPVV
jgi:hypothetical protein